MNISSTYPERQQNTDNIDYVPEKSAKNLKTNYTILEEITLITECTIGSLETVKFLVEVVKKDVNERGNIWVHNTIWLTNSTALHAAVVANRIDVVRYLMKNSPRNINATTGLNPSFEDDEGSTALHLAISHLSGKTQRKMVRCLLAHGADWTITNNAGKQCWELIPINKGSTIRNRIKLSKLLLQYCFRLNTKHNSKSSNIAHTWASSFDGHFNAYSLKQKSVASFLRLWFAFR